MNSPDYQLPFAWLNIANSGLACLKRDLFLNQFHNPAVPSAQQKCKNFCKNVLFVVPLAQVYRYRTGSFKQITSKSPHITNPITHLSMFD